MSLDKSVKFKKEKRKPFYGSESFDKTCRCHGNCPYCKSNRLHKFEKDKPVDDNGNTINKKPNVVSLEVESITDNL